VTVHALEAHLILFASMGFAVAHDFGGAVAVHAFEPSLLMNVWAGPFENAFVSQHPIAGVSSIRHFGRRLVHLMPAFVVGGDPSGAAMTAKTFAVSHLEIEAGMNLGGGGTAGQLLVLVGVEGLKGRLAAVEVAGQAAAPTPVAEILFDGSQFGLECAQVAGCAELPQVGVR
jgi:hypothetical protein